MMGIINAILTSNPKGWYVGFIAPLASFFLPIPVFNFILVTAERQ